MVDKNQMLLLLIGRLRLERTSDNILVRFEDRIHMDIKMVIGHGMVILVYLIFVDIYGRKYIFNNVC